jgi:membrane associated rhomboid family serine protease
VIPLHDANPARRFPLVTILLLLVNVGVYFLVQPMAGEVEQVQVEGQTGEIDGQLAFNLEQAAIPCEVVQGRPLGIDEVEDTFARGDSTACADDDAGTPLFPAKNVLLAVMASMFLHGGLLHLGGNMLFLWIFGNNIEDRLGHVRYLLFYVAAGVVATLAHIAVQPASTVPVVGASGAIAGVMGAYLVWFPRHRVTTLFIFFVILFRQVQARWVLGIWFFSQFLVNPNDGVAWVAHVGGFVFGVVVGLIVRGSSAARRVALTPDHRGPGAHPFDQTSLRDGWRAQP